MKKKEYLCFVLWTNAIFVPLAVTADHIHTRHRRRINENEYESNHIQDVPESSSAIYNTFIINADDAYTPSPFPKETMTTYTTFNERHTPSSSYQQKVLSSNFNHYTPSSNLERKYSKKESRYKKENYNTNNEKEYDYILTAGGKENIYEEDVANGYKPLEFQVAYPEKFDAERIVEQKSPSYVTGKRVSNYEKSFNKYRYSYSNTDENSNKIDGKRTPLKEDDQKSRKDIPKARSYSGSDQPNYQKYQQNQQFVDDFGQKAVGWKQLGPNVEISASQETPLYTRSTENKEKSRKMYKKRQKNPMKSMRAGYMMPQHALYVSNNLQNSKPIKAIFDHNNVLKQSDKFEITDAMINELEKENAKKANEHKVRTKQESPKDQPYNFESPEYQTFQFYNPPVPPYYNVQSPFQVNKLALPSASVSKGFVRNIEVEMNSSGAKKTIPALIIPLTQDQLNNPLFNPDMLAATIINSIDAMMHKVKSQTPFPYDIVNNKFAQNDPNAGLPFDNYQFPIFQYQQLRTGHPFEENYNPYLNFQNQNLIQRLPYGLNTPIQPAVNSQNGKPTPEGAYPPQPLYQDESQGSNLPFSIVIPNKKTNPQDVPKNDFKPSEYYEEGNEESRYLSPSETSNFYSTVNDPKNSRNSSQSFEKSDTRRN